MHELEVIYAETCLQNKVKINRLTVPGGWIYYNEGNGTFVPNVPAANADTNNKKRLKTNTRFIKPTVEELSEQFLGKVDNPKLEAQKFWDFYESKNWYVGKNKMKSWQSAVANWARQNNGRNAPAISASEQALRAKYPDMP
jgi:hypothetical protein